ncbi:tetratricopeptide repeat protein [Streptomyces sp. FXJ1.4098]|nr:tetratricopeptide repeat protein [Streptomyces sp. FXJ1.4098]
MLGLRSVFSVSHRRLSADAARLFRLLSVHPGPEVSRPAAVSLTGETASRTHTALGELTRAQLVTEHRPGRYTFHDLIRAYAFELAEDAAYDGERDAALRRLISHYMHTAKVAVGLLDEHRSGIDLVPVEPGVVPESMADASEALRWLTAEHPVLLTVIGTATRAGLDIHTWQLTWTLSHFHAVHGHLHEWLSSTTIGLRAAERVGDVLGQALSHRALARVETRLGGYADAEAHGIRALALFRELGDAGGQARTHLSLGWLHDQQNRHREALDHVEQALALFRASGNTVGEARALNAGAWTRTRLGDHERAVDQCRQALAILQSIGDRTGEAATWDTLGSAYQWRGGHAEAADCYRQAIGLYQEIGDRYWEAETLTRLGETSKAAGDTGAALRAWGDALAILDTVGHPKADQLRDRLIAVLAHSDPANRLADSAG